MFVIVCSASPSLHYMITYIDRVCISNVVPSIQKEFGFSIVTMGWVLSSFQWGYAIFQIPSAWLGDRYGPRRAMAAIVTLWSAFTCGVTLAWNAASMAVIQFLFGTAESGSFPIATSALSRWILPDERGIAQGMTHAGARLGGAITPFLVVLIIGRWGWRAAFIACASLGVLWAAAWYWYYRDSPADTARMPGELDLIQTALAGDNRSSRRYSLEPDSAQSTDVDPIGNVLLLRLYPWHLPGLVSDISSCATRFRS